MRMLLVVSVFLSTVRALADAALIDRLAAPLRAVTALLGEADAKRVTLERANRCYANVSKLESFSTPLSTEDLSSDLSSSQGTAWIGAPYRFSVLVVSFVVYPEVIEACRSVLDVPSTADMGRLASEALASGRLSGVGAPPTAQKLVSDITALTQSFAPAIALLYGAWLSLTFQILEERLGSLQRTATLESAQLATLARRTALLASSGPPPRALEGAFRIIWEQTTMLAVGSRADELVSIANADPYSEYERTVLRALQQQQRPAVSAGDANSAEVTAVARSAANSCISVVETIGNTRAERLSKETKSLPGAHFFILFVFSIQLLSTFVFAVAGTPGTENDLLLRLLFSFFCGTYLLVFNFAVDLNSPFEGNYQIRRSAINANLVATRRTIADAVGLPTATLWQLDEDR